MPLVNIKVASTNTLSVAGLGKVKTEFSKTTFSTEVGRKVMLAKFMLFAQSGLSINGFLFFCREKINSCLAISKSLGGSC